MVSDDDSVVLEDESGRIKLIGDEDKLPVGRLSTGTVAAFLGKEDSYGNFAVVSTRHSTRCHEMHG